MLRATASALIVFLLLPFCWPLLQPGNESSLPACCRRGGKHRCAMMTRFQLSDRNQDAQLAVRSWAGLCPYRSMLFAPAAPRAASPPASRDFYARLTSNPAVFLQVVLKARISDARSHHKRGPPSFFA